MIAKIMTSAAAAALFIAGTTTAFAQAQPPGSFYLGAQLGGDQLELGSSDGDGVSGGIFGGYRFQAAPRFFIAGEADLGTSGAEISVPGEDVGVEYSAGLSGLAGYEIIDTVSVYGRVGYDFISLDTNTLSDDTANGFKLGIGVDGEIVENVNARVEYTFFDYGDIGGEDLRRDQISAGVYFRF